MTKLSCDLETITANIAELVEEQATEEGVFSDAAEKISRADVAKRLKEMRGDTGAQEEVAILDRWMKLNGAELESKRKLKEAEGKLDALAYDKYHAIGESECKSLVVDAKWLTDFEGDAKSLMDSTCQNLTERIADLSERYATSLPTIVDLATRLNTAFDSHLHKMGFSW